MKLFTTQEIAIAALQAAERGAGEISGPGGIASMGGSTPANVGVLYQFGGR